MKLLTADTMAIARGEQPAAIVLKGGSVVNVFSGEVIAADVAIQDGYIIGVGRFDGKTELDCTGQYLVPGLIDAHLHLESTMVHPAELVYQAALKGTTTFVIDPHEAGNVAGTKGIDFMLEATEQATGNVYMMVPSCVPASVYDDSGATLLADDLAPYLNHPRVLGLGELMSSDEIVTADSAMIQKIELFSNTVLDGHAGYFSDAKLNAYRYAGVETDHECTTYHDALRELRAGFYVHIREGSATKNLDDIVTGIVANQLATQRFCFCTDDKHISEIIEQGHISYNVRRAIELGLSPIAAIQMATINAATCYGLKRHGAIAAGYQADILIVDDLETFAIADVYFKGQRLTGEEHIVRPDVADALQNTIHIKPYREADLALAVDQVHTVINTVDGQILTKKTIEVVPSQAGIFVPDAVYNKVAVFERHRATGKIGVGILKGYGISGGAIAATVSHDSHNLIVVGDNDRDIIVAARTIEAMGGGFCIAANGRDIARVPLAIMGLMSIEPHQTVEAQLDRMLSCACEMGVNPHIDPLVTLSFLALTVIPEVRITPRGLIEVSDL